VERNEAHITSASLTDTTILETAAVYSGKRKLEKKKKNQRLL
jgi:hypothetical protein